VHGEAGEVSGAKRGIGSTKWMAVISEEGAIIDVGGRSFCWPEFWECGSLSRAGWRSGIALME
jgi:hypothetical protein